MKRLLSVLCSILLSGAVHAATADPTSAEAAAERVTTLAQTPPMGWSSWNYYGDRINEKIIIDTIDKMVASGLRDAGYIYVNIDDGWQKYKGSRADHPLTYDEKKFPRGIKYLADYAHQKGMKLGIYSGPGNSTCAGYVGSEGHEKQDAAMFASWGVDHLKYDSCCSHQQASQAVLKTVFGDMSKALQATGRPIVYHACHCGWQNIWQWGNSVGANQWRIGQDISDDFNYPGNREGYYFDVLDMIDRGVGLEAYSGKGHWNDYDMLVIGLHGHSKELVGTGASNTEYRTHFSMWAILSSPLLIGANLDDLNAADMVTLKNKEIIALNQDPLGLQAKRYVNNGDQQIFAKPLADGSWAVALLNRSGQTATMTLNLHQDLDLPWKKTLVRDLWTHRDVATVTDSYSSEVQSHEAKMLVIRSGW
ncbi:MULTISPECIES: glycoside hydrolase family 27 protein [Serratia]|uniref:glycoside hydrolase family 27 protein n=1 Tax=Serratia TaxID=613 RepID=UPI000664EC63|nr:MULTISPECIES: glycoside hydrolase family 27 protein [Serratia]HBK4689271.1 glycoside hydrolase family 27 protein [Serratia marcescens]